MSLIETARKTLTELPISDVLRERLSLALEESAATEKKCERIQMQFVETRAVLKTCTEERDHLRDQLAEFQRKHEEEVVLLKSVEFRRGKRTGEEWTPFCPKCHLPLVISRHGGDFVACNDQKECGWQYSGVARDLHGIESGLPS